MTLLTTALALLAGTGGVAAQQCAPVPPPTCEIDSQFLNGRWDLSGITGSFDVSGQETYQADATYEEVIEEILIYADVMGTLTVEMVGGPDQNYLDVACDGTVTGMASERITGRLLKPAVNPYICGPTGFTDTDMDWDVTLERTYRIEGMVTGPGELTVDFIVESATAGIDGYFVLEEDCFWTSWSEVFTEFDITGSEETESVRLSGGYDPIGYQFNPDVEYLGDPWVKQMANRLQLYYQPLPDMVGPDVDPPPFDLLLHPADWTPPDFHEQLELMLQEIIEVTPDVKFDSAPKTPVVTNIELTEPSTYLSDVSVTTMAIATIDWRDADGARTVDFTYGGTTETVTASGDTATFNFDAGEPGTTIDTVARAGGEESRNYSLRVAKTSLPSWAGSPGNWSGSSGVTYDGTVNWPISLETTKTVSALALFAGVFGIEGSASSEYNAKALSSGSPLSGDLMANASFKFAGKGSSLTMTGNTETTLSCGELSTNGTASVSVPPANWQKTLNPVTLIPGVSAAACALSGALCSLINSIGVKARAFGSIGGSADYEGSSGPLMFTGGSVSGSLGGSVSASAVPRPLSVVAQVTLSGGASGCLEVQVPPDFKLSKVGGQLTASASLSVLGFGTTLSDTIPFGDSCGGGAKSWLDDVAFLRGVTPSGTGWVPADGHLAIGLLPDETPGDLAVAAWSEPRVDAPRPAGDLWLRVHEGGAWEPILPLTDDLASDMAPAVALVDGDAILVVHMRNETPQPSEVSGLDAWAPDFDLHYALVDRATGAVTDAGLLTEPGFDFGPQLVRDRNGGIHLFWQRATGFDFIGSPAAPASIHHRRFSQGAWGAATVVADGLAGVFGWQAAALDVDTQLVALTLDVDQDLSTDADREIALVERGGGLWGATALITGNSVVDDSPLVSYDAAGRPLVMWRRGNAVMELATDGATVETAFTTPDPATDDGVGALFHAAQLVTGPAGSAVVWPDSHQLAITRRLTDMDAAAPWAEPALLAPGATAQQVIAIGSQKQQLRVAWTTQAFNDDGVTLADHLTPVISNVEFGSCASSPACDAIFESGFE